MCSAPDGYGSIDRQKNFGRAGSSVTSKARVSFQNFCAAASTACGS
jgi:hypothetical protein